MIVFRLITSALLFLILSGCSPKFNWREFHGTQAPYTVLMPGKPDELQRAITLGTQTVNMSMTAVQIDGVNFAVGAAKLPDATQAQLALAIMKQALVQNIAGTVEQEKTVADRSDGQLETTTDISASGSANSIPLRLTARLVARDVWVYQVLAVGPGKAMNPEAIDTFLSSFKSH